MNTADKRAASVDDDAAGITEDAAIDWLRQEYGLPEGAAILQLKRSWDSGTVRGWDNLVEIGQHGETVLRDGKPMHIPPRISQLIPDCFVHDFRLHADDLRWQIEQQLGKPPAAKAPERNSEPPLQAKLDQALLDLATARGEKVKQSDDEARKMLVDLGATTRQIPKAFRHLPEEYRYPQARPRKSSA